MAHTNIDIAKAACAEVMRRYQLESKDNAVNLALKALAAEPFYLRDAKQLCGIAWECDLDKMRRS